MGKGGKAALHDSSEAEVRAAGSHCLHAEHEGYDWVVLTDISSVFGSWHRASAGVPEEFSRTVRDKAGARVPLFSAMAAFKVPLNLPVSSITFNATDAGNRGMVWFAAKTNSKPGFSNLPLECWTIISTPEYALKKIEETPMQDPVTGEFIPQSPDYLLQVPGPELLSEFLRLCGREKAEVSYLNAQRWGSAMPANREVARDVSSSTRKILSGVAYDTSVSPLVPTVCFSSAEESVVYDDSLNVICAGDMVSSFTPGFEGAVLSALEAVKLLNQRLAT